ncbi:MAG: hybrid sensor histidine kinase/response regulator [Leptolyngbyaceae cyanobacterium CSU_1_3]|nr:hybrid sensor histidine kinase/response regulator [Leptolyngbyaceae cyanobacterium CSU_1_3]
MSTANILIVEDESIIALDIQSSLINAGYKVVAIATCASEALNDAAYFKPDLVLMDIRLRGERDGIETAEKIHQMLHLPVVYLTAHADENTLSRAKITEPFGYILKPFEDRELITTIEIALSRHKAESAIQLALDKERELHELKSRFVSVVSHEFRNPLNAILFSTELLDRYGDQLTQEKKTTYLQRIQLSVKRMNQLLNEVLLVGETEAGKLQYKPQLIDLLKFCQDLIEEIKLAQMSTCSIILTYQKNQSETSKDSEQFSSLDEKLLRHILTNLISNAIKYSPQGESILIDISCDYKNAIFRIQDHGIGIPECDQAQLFSSFHRASNVHTIPGTGLGLSIVKQCVDLHGGNIEVVSQVGQGSTFTVTLPLSNLQADEKDFGD